MGEREKEERGRNLMGGFEPVDLMPHELPDGVVVFKQLLSAVLTSRVSMQRSGSVWDPQYGGVLPHYRKPIFIISCFEVKNFGSFPKEYVHKYLCLVYSDRFALLRSQYVTLWIVMWP